METQNSNPAPNALLRELLDTDGQTLCDFILFCGRVGRSPSVAVWQWFQARRNDPKDKHCFLSRKG